MAQTFGSPRQSQAKAPERGVFPLDHFGDCKSAKAEYLECLKESGSDAVACRDVAKSYLECRMKRDLMLPQELNELGFGAEGDRLADLAKTAQENPIHNNEYMQQHGFVAGIRTAKARGAE